MLRLEQARRLTRWYKGWMAPLMLLSTARMLGRCAAPRRCLPIAFVQNEEEGEKQNGGGTQIRHAGKERRRRIFCNAVGVKEEDKDEERGRNSNSNYTTYTLEL